MINLYLIFSCVVFVELFLVLHLKGDALKLAGGSREALEVVRSPDLSDDQKEVFMRKSSVYISKLTLLLSVKFLLIFLVLFLIYWLTVTVYPASEQQILKSFYSPTVIAFLTLLAMAYSWVRSSALSWMRNVYLK